jgi:asparagine synthase (glutamine-hydrolysing)
MCGIIGQFNFHGKISPQDIQRLKSSLAMLNHRGPDAEGTFIQNKVFLGHRRLSILDISNKANQPMSYKSCSIVFNGEIYNFKNLKQDLLKLKYKFETTSDTEVLLKAYVEWGDSFIDKLDGCWAFCIYDEKRERLFLSRDRIGEKPLLYHIGENGITFCSEMPPILKLLGKEEINVDYENLSQFNLYNFKHIPHDLTPFKDIKKLKPGYNLIVERKKVKLKNTLKYLKLRLKNLSKNSKKFSVGV